LKNQLLERIKAHKNKEVSMGGGAVSSANVMSDEFDDSMAYLSSIAKQSKETINKNTYTRNTSNAMSGGQNKTLKNYNAIPETSFHVELDLPAELKETPMTFHIPTNDAPIILTPPNSKYMVDNQVPYGCLKNGIKPTFKSWNKTQRQPPTEQPLLTINNSSSLPAASSTTTTRETKMKELKEKMRRKQQSLELSQPPAYKPSSIPNPKPISNSTPIELDLPAKTNSIITSNPELNEESNLMNDNNITQQIPVSVSPLVEDNPSTIQMAQIAHTGGSKKIKKTIKRTYTLGKSKMHKRVGVLIKDKTMRKRVLQAQRDIKRHNINDVKQYLRTHGLMKAGSSAPNDIVRKIYESAMLSGEVTNQDKDILLQNYLKEKEES
jgi:hypothetical protein